MDKAVLGIREIGTDSLSEVFDRYTGSNQYENAYAGYSDAVDMAIPSTVREELSYKSDHYHFINLNRINSLRHINKFFEAVNNQLEVGDRFIGCFECKEQRKERIFKTFPSVAAYPLYLLDFIWNRVFPKTKFLYKIYYKLTPRCERALTVPEVLGRLISCGFKICNYYRSEGKTYFSVEKINDPVYDNSPTYGPLISLSRVGLNGKPIKVYKLRTMHPYSEYLQQYIYEQNDLQDGGKFNGDFRVTRWGKFMRKFWLDELPMLLNWLKGDVQLIGVRPLSQHYFELYPKTFQERRKKYKPGLVPPFYAHLPTSFEQILASERRYLMEYDKRPVRTTLKYSVLAFYNIIFKRARSK